jgi:hypothetical protein
MIYRICTEYRPNLAELTARYFNCFTINTGVGYWNGVAETSATIEIAAATPSVENRYADRLKVFMLADDVRHDNGQEAVLVQEVASINTLVYADRQEVL